MKRLFTLLLAAGLVMAGCSDDDDPVNAGGDTGGDSGDAGDSGSDSGDGGDSADDGAGTDDGSDGSGDSGADSGDSGDGGADTDGDSADDGDTGEDGEDGGDTTGGADAGDGGDSGDGGSSGGLFPGADVDICALFEPEELAPFVDFPIEEGEPFFSGSSSNSCDWVSPVDAEFDDIGSISIRLNDAATFVAIDDQAYPLEGVGESAAVEARYGQTYVVLGDSVVTFQVVGMLSPTPDIAEAYPHIQNPPGSLTTTNDTHASIALALAFTDRLTG